MLAYLAVLVNPDDDINLLRIVNTPPRGLSDTVVESATLMSQERKESVFKTMISEEFQRTLSKRAATAPSGSSWPLSASGRTSMTGGYPDPCGYDLGHAG